MSRLPLAAAVLAAAVPAPPAGAASLPRVPSGARPGPDLLYREPAKAPQLTNRGPWRAKPILVSGTHAYRGGEFLYQDFLYDDHGARLAADPGDPRARNAGDLFSKPNGTVTYPRAPGYAHNAADLVEFRVRPLRRATAFRVTLNTLADPALPAFSVAIGGREGRAFPFPAGANVRAPARRFLTVHPGRRGMVADFTDAAGGERVPGPRPRVRVDRRRRQVQVTVPHRTWNPRARKVRLAMGVGLWDRAAGRYLLPQRAADRTRPGGAGVASTPAAFFNVAFRTGEPLPSAQEGLSAVANAAWWRDRAQGTALAAGDLTPLSATVDFRKLARRVRDDSEVPRTGALNRILASHFEPAQGLDFSGACGFEGSFDPRRCEPEYRGRLQPYAIYVPKGRRPQRGWGMTLLLHSLSANYNQYLGSRNQRQFGERGAGSIVITPESRGPDQFYEGYGAADVFEVWADVARRYRLDPDWTVATGYSMGGIGTFKLAAQFPDLFARAQPTVGFENTDAVLASLRNVPVLMWNDAGDELVNAAFFNYTASALDRLGYRYELDTFQPCTSPGCPPLFPNHLALAVNDQYAPAAEFLGTARVNRDPRHVTYVAERSRDRPELGIVGDHAYWVSRIVRRDVAAPRAIVDAVSGGFGAGGPPVSASTTGGGTLTGGSLGPFAFASTKRTWGRPPRAPVRDAIDVALTNVRSVALDVRRARVSCRADVDVVTDGPVRLKLLGCGRTVKAGQGAAPADARHASRRSGGPRGRVSDASS